jgi:hypothetical protein
MRAAFAGIAKVMSEAGVLTEDCLRNEIPLLVWNAAVSAGWYRFASETPQAIFPTQRGHYWLWLDKTQNWDDIFYSQVAPWRAWLLDQTPKESGPLRQEDSSAQAMPTVANVTVAAPFKQEFSQKPAREWHDLTITFISDERVSVAFTGTDNETRNYEEIGFADRRGGKPCQAWIILRELSGDPKGPWRIDKKRAQDIRSRLRRLFKIESDPFPFAERQGYSPRFTLTRSQAFES